MSAKPVGAGAASQRSDSEGCTIWLADPQRDDGKRFVAHAEEKFTAFVELESAVCARGKSDLTSRRAFPKNVRH